MSANIATKSFRTNIIWRFTKEMSMRNPIRKIWFVPTAIRNLNLKVLWEFILLPITEHFPLSTNVITILWECIYADKTNTFHDIMYFQGIPVFTVVKFIPTDTTLKFTFVTFILTKNTRVQFAMSLKSLVNY